MATLMTGISMWKGEPLATGMCRYPSVLSSCAAMPDKPTSKSSQDQPMSPESTGILAGSMQIQKPTMLWAKNMA